MGAAGYTETIKPPIKLHDDITQSIKFLISPAVSAFSLDVLIISNLCFPLPAFRRVCKSSALQKTLAQIDLSHGSLRNSLISI